MDETYLNILRMIQDGTISAEDGEKLLAALETGAEPNHQPQNGLLSVEEVAAGEDEEGSTKPPDWAHRTWLYLAAAGVLLMSLAGLVTVPLVQGGNRLGWLACTMPLMVFGALVFALAWWSRTARWLHVRVRNQGTRFNFSLPLSLRPAAWLIRLAQPWIPQLRDMAIDELILSLEELQGEGILAVEVNEGKGEEVQVYVA